MAKSQKRYLVLLGFGLLEEKLRYMKKQKKFLEIH